MDSNKIKILIRRFNDGELDSAGLKELEKLIEEGKIDIHHLESVSSIYESLDNIPIPEPGKNLDESFYSLLGKEKNKRRSGIRALISKLKTLQEKQLLIIKPAFSVILLIIGFLIGNIFSYTGNIQKIEKLTNDLQQVQSLMMFTLLEKPSASERLKAIQISRKFESPNEKMIDALLLTLNSDNNPNIRLAAIESLLKYASNEKVRIGMVESIVNQDLPIVQVALADAMVLIQEKRAVEKFKILLENDKTLLPVKEKITRSIEKLI